MRLHILFRSCDRSDQRRYINAPKQDIMLASLSSVIAASRRALREVPDLTLALHVLDDHSAAETLVRMGGMLTQSGLHAHVRPVAGTGQAASMRYSNEYARTLSRDLLYFVEDDYLHEEGAIAEMLEAYRLFSKNLGGKEVVISPC